LKFNFHTSFKSLIGINEKLLVKNPFIGSSFLSIFKKHHQKNIKHYFLSFEDDSIQGLIYAQQFKIGGRQIKGYQKKNNIRKQLNSIFLGMLSFKIIGFGNNFLTNESSISSQGNLKNQSLFLKKLIQQFFKRECINKFIFPDHFFESLAINDPQKIFPKLIALEVEEDMSLQIRPSWKNINDYKNDLSKKYRKKIKKVFSKSDPLIFKILSQEDIKINQQKMQELFNNVRESSAFYSVPFNVESFSDFNKIENPKSKIYGCYLEDKLIAFSSEWITENKLYSYFIGLDYKYNRTYSVYERILYNTINNGIKKGVDSIVFGRTAAEFKSNFGATPKKSFIYIYLRNPVLRFLLRPILLFIKPKKWTQRNPFKS
jgi:hypothetical protein